MFKTGIIDGRNKKQSPPPDWATIRLGNAWHRNRRSRRCVTLLAKIDPETPEGMPPEPLDNLDGEITQARDLNLKIHVPRCSYELKFNHQVNAIPEFSTVVKLSHRVDIADRWIKQSRLMFACCNQGLKSEQLRTYNEHRLKILSLLLIYMVVKQTEKQNAHNTT